MIKKSLSTAFLLALLVLPLIGCNSQTQEEKPAPTSASIDNNSPAAKTAVGIPPPDSGMPPPGGGGGLKGKKR
ncbi:hypothetical protein [Armatimonas sp.]|uniref:hypothetical protein n=1 Tax=Armatimonas sp. TaxID=1872638 RepID=UPI00375355D8